jgi:hypothetical protein
MSLQSVKSCSLLLAVLTTGTLAAQPLATSIPNTGCFDGSAVGAPIAAHENQLPSLGNSAFTLAHTCPFGGESAFFILGTCTPPPVSWPLTHPCFAAWTAPPASCQFGYDVFVALDGSMVRQDGKVLMPFAIPNDPNLMGVSFCFQFICANLPQGRCTGISQGFQITIG